MLAWRSIFVQVVEVEVEQPRGFVGILFVEWHEAIAEVEGYGCGIGIDGDEAAASLVVGYKIMFDEVKQQASNVHTLSFSLSLYILYRALISLSVMRQKLAVALKAS